MQYNIYFRKENWERFKDEENKSELINGLLATHYLGGPTPGPQTASETPADDFKLFLKEYSDGVRKPPHPKYGYPCCHKKTKCKHWQWNQDSETYINEFTGAEKAAV